MHAAKLCGSRSASCMQVQRQLQASCSAARKAGSQELPTAQPLTLRDHDTFSVRDSRSFISSLSTSGCAPAAPAGPCCPPAAGSPAPCSAAAAACAAAAAARCSAAFLAALSAACLRSRSISACSLARALSSCSLQIKVQRIAVGNAGYWQRPSLQHAFSHPTGMANNLATGRRQEQADHPT